jgi:hypothetical protein
MLICGLLDLLSQLVSTFPHIDEIVVNAEDLALRLIRRSDKRAFRYKSVCSPDIHIFLPLANSIV